MPLYSRTLQPAIEAKLFKGKAIVIYGARQVGNTESGYTLEVTTGSRTRWPR